MTSTKATTTLVVVRVDGNSNVRLALPKGAFLAVGIEPSEHDILEPSDIPGHYEARFGAASGKDIADFARLPRDPHEWPEKVHGVARWLAAAVPFATDRIRRELLGGQKRKPAIYCDDLAMARGEDPEETRRRLKASAAPSIAHPAVEKDVEAATRLLGRSRRGSGHRGRRSVRRPGRSGRADDRRRQLGCHLAQGCVAPDQLRHAAGVLVRAARGRAHLAGVRAV